MKTWNLFDAPDEDEPDDDRPDDSGGEPAYPSGARPERILHWRDMANGQFVTAPANAR